MPILGTTMPIMGNSKKTASRKSIRAPAATASRGKPLAKSSTKIHPRAPRASVVGAPPGRPLLAREAGAVYRVAAKPVPPGASGAPSASGLANALFTTTQQRVLGLLFGNPERSYFANELIAITGSGSGAVQRELARLESSGLVTARWLGNQKHYQANKASPIFAGLQDIVQKTCGAAGPLQEALRPLADQIRAAFVYGSLAKQQESAASDIDVMVISDSLDYADLFSALEPATARLGRPVNPTVLSLKELAKRRRGGNGFVGRVLAQPKIWLVGGESDLGNL